MPAGDDPIQPFDVTPVTISVDGTPMVGIAGQSIAGVIMANNRLDLRRTAGGDHPRGVFCGIGVCFDCLVEVNGLRDVRACQRKATEGDVVTTREARGGDSLSGPADSRGGAA
ncbi:MAG: (2Fe-2S)-binding protein [Cryobacterium sp.]|nr:(2Fe-2S)-binding protein [Cryobacterium sp.]